MLNLRAQYHKPASAVQPVDAEDTEPGLLRQENTFLHEQLEELQQERNRLLEKLIELQKRPPASGGYRVLTDRLEETRSRLAEIERERDTAHEKALKLSEDMDALRTSAWRFIADVRALGASAASQAGNSAADVGEPESPAVDLAVLDRHFKDTCKDLEAHVGHARLTDIKQLEKQLHFLEITNEEKERELEQFVLKARELEESLIDRDKQAIGLKEELVRLRRDLGESRESQHHAEEANESLLGNLSQLRCEINDLRNHADLSLAPSGGQTWRFAGRIWSPLAAALLGALLVLASIELLSLNSGRGELITSLLASGQAVTADAPAAPHPGQRPTIAQSSPDRNATAEIRHTEKPRGKQDIATLSPTAPERSAPPRVIQDRLLGGGTGLSLVLIRGGDFTMGSDRFASASNERPAHNVRVRPFLITQTEITFKEFDRFARATGRPLPKDEGWGRGNRPVINVSWQDAQAYVRWMSRQTGENYRLPTEAEWEYAASGGTHAPYWWGYEQRSGTAVCFQCGTEWDNLSTAPVASFAPNRFGLYDTAGNAMEWVQDCYYPNYAGAPADGSARVADGCMLRVTRGGAFNKPLDMLRTTARKGFEERARLNMLGFRVVRDI